jgi:hypothetical protein
VRWFNMSLRDMAGKISKEQRLALCSAIFGTPVVSTKYLTTGQISAYAMVAVNNPDEMKLLIQEELDKESVI